MTPTPVEESNMQKTHNPTPVEGSDSEITAEMRKSCYRDWTEYRDGETTTNYPDLTSFRAGYIYAWRERNTARPGDVTIQLAYETGRREAVEEFVRRVDESEMYIPLRIEKFVARIAEEMLSQ